MATKRKVRVSPDKIAMFNRECDRILKFIREIDATTTMHGRRWKISMVNHYNRQLKTLCDESPKGCGASGRRYMVEASKLVAKIEAGS